MGRGTPGSWTSFADALLAREAALARASRSEPHDLPGLFVDDGDAASILVGLSGGPVEDERLRTTRRQADDVVDRARRAFHASLEERSAFAQLVRRAHLGRHEAEVLALLAAVEVDDRRQRLLTYIQDSIHLPRLTLVGLARFLPGSAGVRAVAPGSRMVRSALVEVEDRGPWATRMVAPAPRVVWFLRGDDAADPGLHPDAEVVRARSGRTEGEPLVLVVGADRASRLAVAVERTAGDGCLIGPVPASDEGWRALVREATVAGLSPVLEVDGDLTPTARQVIGSADHLSWAVCSPAELALESVPDRPWVEVHAPSVPAPAEEWRHVLGPAVVPTHPLTREQLRLAARATSAVGGDIDRAVRRLASGHLDRMALVVRPHRGWGDLVALPPDQLDQLRELVARYRHRGVVHDEWGFPARPSPGLVALFSGSSGTGKTLAAEVVAGELGLDMYKVELSAVVSKYIGETEKNLERIFSAAAAGSVVLFFDEADALFGRRSEVGDAHDRYANIEVSYLLQRLESYQGMVVLATNLQRNMDAAFLRRIHVSVEFPMPDELGRLEIWRLSFPRAAPLHDVDPGFLARRFKIPGGAIRNAALTAAFLAAEGGVPITMELVIQGLKREFQKLGRLRTETDFDRYFDLVRGEPDAAPVG